MIFLEGADDVESRSQILAKFAAKAREDGRYALLQGWRDELYPIYGPDGDLLLVVERSAAPLFGMVTYGAHCTAYVETDEGLKIWVPRRAKTKETYPSMLDNSAAGGIPSGEMPFEAMVRECEEEASLPEEIVRKSLKQVGCVTFFMTRPSSAGGETGLLQPECFYVFDLKVDAEMILTPADGEAESFELMTIPELQTRMANGEVKPNCILVLLDFFVRHGIITPENEPDFTEIVTRLHRRLPLPVWKIR